jgi:tetratricopeptide (TPR) repeat protein
LIALATVAAYLPALRGDFIWNYADYVTRPALRSLHGLWRIWFEVGSNQTLLERNPACWMACNNLGIAYYRIGRLPEAIAAYHGAVQLDPAFAEVRSNLGAALAQSGRLAEAIVEFEQAAKLNPDSAKARQNLSRALRLAGREPSP